MSGPGAKSGDRVQAVDTHIVMVPSPGGPVPVATPCVFDGLLVENLSCSVFIDNSPVAVEGSVALNSVPHAPVGGSFQKPPSNRATVDTGSGSVLVSNKKAARDGDRAVTCNDPADAPKGVVLAQGTVFFGD